LTSPLNELCLPITCVTHTSHHEIFSILWIDDQDVDDFMMEYDEIILKDLPRALVCTQKGITRFPFKNCEIDYGEVKNDGVEEEEDSYCSANSVAGPAMTHLNPAFQGDACTPEKMFFLVYKNVDNKRFNEL